MNDKTNNVPASRTDYGLLLLRFAGLALLLTAGWEKVTGLVAALQAGKSLSTAGLAPLIGKMGFPLPALCALYVVVNESLGGLLITCGVVTRLAAFCAALSMTGAFYTALHFGWEPLRAFLLLGIFATIAVAGPGRFSLNKRFVNWHMVSSVDGGLVLLRGTLLVFFVLLFTVKANPAASFVGGHATIWLTVAAILAGFVIVGCFAQQAAVISALIWTWGACWGLKAGLPWDIHPYRDGMVVLLFMVLAITGPGRYSIRRERQRA